MPVFEYAENKGTCLPARRVVSAFVFRCLNGVISLVPVLKSKHLAFVRTVGTAGWYESNLVRKPDKTL